MCVFEYVIDYHLLASESPWNEKTSMDIFNTGLNERIKEELSTRDFPQSLKQIEELATQIDLCLLERHRDPIYQLILTRSLLWIMRWHSARLKLLVLNQCS